MAHWLYVLLLFFASPLYAKCHDVLVDSAGSADFIQQIQQVTASGRLYLYSAPAAACKSSNVFLVAGVNVSVQERHAKSGFSYVTYYTQDRRIAQGWLKTDRLVAQNSGDVLREDINPDPAAKAARQVSLLMSLQGQCKFYESFEDSNDDETLLVLLVREDHLSPGCRGGADPEVSPVVGNVFIDE